MGFKVKKIVTEDSDDIQKAMSDVVLLMASLAHDNIENKEYRKARERLESLKWSIRTFEEVLDNKLKENDGTGNKISNGKKVAWSNGVGRSIVGLDSIDI